MRLPSLNLPAALIAPAAFLGAAVLAVLGAFWAAIVIENRSTTLVTSQLMNEGMTWASVSADGLQVHLTGTAPNEVDRFRAISLAGTVVDASRVRDKLDVMPTRAIQPPRFSVEMLRNDDGIQLFGLMPTSVGGPVLAEEAAALAAGLQVTDILDTAAFDAPEGWDEALAFGLEALKMLPRSKISVSAERVAITAISGSAAEKRKLETELKRIKPEGLILDIDISAPRPVLTPFTLRFVKDAAAAKFDACSADTERARDRILRAAFAAGAEGRVTCTVGMGVPSPRWAEAAEAAIRAVGELGRGSVTFSDADVTLLADPETSQATFDKVVGELQTALPPVFSLKATLPPKPAADQQGPAEFTAVLNEAGKVELRGRLTDALLRTAVDAYAKSRFGANQVYTATRFDTDLPAGWPVRVLAGLESLAELEHGNLVVRADTVEVTGVTGSQGARARISQILSDKLGQGQTFRISVTYDEKLDPLAALPTPEECMVEVSAALLRGKITFAPGSAEIAPAADKTLDALAQVLLGCPDLALEVSAHSDSQGSEGGNKALSQARAEAVLLSLQGRGAPVLLLRAVGYGEERPVADNATEAGREANRRIEFTRIDEAGQAGAAMAGSSGAKLAGPAAPEKAGATAGTEAADSGREAAEIVAGSGSAADTAIAVETPAAVDGGVVDASPDAAPVPSGALPAEAASAPAGPVAPVGAAPPLEAQDDAPSVAPTDNTVRPKPRGTAP